MFLMIDRKIQKLNNIQDAFIKHISFILQNNLASSTYKWNNYILDDDMHKIGWISYNGRIWDCRHKDHELIKPDAKTKEIIDSLYKKYL